MSLFVDTSVWSLALRRDRPADVPEVGALERALAEGELVTTTGLVYQELRCEELGGGRRAALEAIASRLRDAGRIMGMELLDSIVWTHRPRRFGTPVVRRPSSADLTPGGLIRYCFSR